MKKAGRRAARTRRLARAASIRKVSESDLRLLAAEAREDHEPDLVHVMMHGLLSALRVSREQGVDDFQVLGTDGLATRRQPAEPAHRGARPEVGDDLLQHRIAARR